MARTKSIRRAADRLQIAPSAVGRQLLQLEHSLGTPLLERTNTGVHLTAAGAMVERYTHNMFRELDRLQSTINDFKGLQQGEVKVWVVEGVVPDFLPRAIAEFNEKYPGIRFNVQMDVNERIMEALIGNEAEIGITFHPRPHPEVPVVAERTEPVMCLMSKHHEFAGRHSVTLAELCSWPIALPAESFGLREIFEASTLWQKLSPRIRLTANSPELLKAYILAANTLTIVPATSCFSQVDHEGLVAVPIEDDILARVTLSICIHGDRPLSFAANEFLKKLIDEFQSGDQRSSGGLSVSVDAYHGKPVE